MARKYIQSRYTEDELKELLQSYRTSGLSVREIADKLDSTERTISRWLKQFGLTNRVTVDLDMKAVISDYENNMTANELAMKYGVSIDTILRRLSSVGIVVNRVENIQKHFLNAHKKLWSDIEYDLNSGLSFSDTALKYHLRPSSLRRLMSFYNYKPKFVGDLTEIQHILSNVSSIKNVRKRQSVEKYMTAILNYVSEFQIKPTMSALARYMNVSVQTVASWFRVNGFEYLLDNGNMSYQVKKVLHVLDDMGISYELNNRSIVRPMEIDVWIPTYNVGIEINPTTTHCCQCDIDCGKISRMYHQEKSLACLEKGVRLIHIYDWDIFEDNIVMVLSNLIYQSTMVDMMSDVFVLDLNKPVISEQCLFDHGFVRQSIVCPGKHYVNRNTCRISIDVDNPNVVSVYDAGKIVYVRM